MLELNVQTDRQTAVHGDLLLLCANNRLHVGLMLLSFNQVRGCV